MVSNYTLVQQQNTIDQINLTAMLQMELYQGLIYPSTSNCYEHVVTSSGAVTPLLVIQSCFEYSSAPTSPFIYSSEEKLLVKNGVVCYRTTNIV